MHCLRGTSGGFIILALSTRLNSRQPQPLPRVFHDVPSCLTSPTPSLTLPPMIVVGQPIPFQARTKLRIPLASANVQAGFPSPAEDHMENSLDLNEHLVSNPAATFFVRVQGSSMRDAGIQGGDILVVDRSVIHDHQLRDSLGRHLAQCAWLSAVKSLSPSPRTLRIFSPALAFGRAVHQKRPRRAARAWRMESKASSAGSMSASGRSCQSVTSSRSKITPNDSARAVKKTSHTGRTRPR